MIESRKQEEITVNDLRQPERGYLKELMEAEHKLSGHGIRTFGKSGKEKMKEQFGE